MAPKKAGNQSKKQGTSIPLHHTGREIHLKDTGTRYKVGDELSPKWADLRVVYRKLWDMGYERKLVPTTMIEDILVQCNQDQGEYLVIHILRQMDLLWSNEAVPAVDLLAFEACAWLIAWYWHKRMGGPKPIAHGPDMRFTYNQDKKRLNYGAIPDLFCPFCTKRFPVPSNLVRQSAIFAAYHRWLAGHAVTYHHWPRPSSTERKPKAPKESK